MVLAKDRSPWLALPDRTLAGAPSARQRRVRASHTAPELSSPADVLPEVVRQSPPTQRRFAGLHAGQLLAARPAPRPKRASSWVKRGLFDSHTVRVLEHEGCGRAYSVAWVRADRYLLFASPLPATGQASADPGWPAGISGAGRKQGERCPFPALVPPGWLVLYWQGQPTQRWSDTGRVVSVSTGYRPRWL